MCISIKKLHKSYGGKSVLNHIDLEIKKGSIFGLLGVNGAGKTTLVSILNFLVNQDSGEVKFFGKDGKSDEKEIKSFSSYVPQSFAFYPNLSAYENLEFFGSLYGLKGVDLKNQIQKVLEITSLKNEANVKARKYSGGYKRRLNLAIGLLNNPSILYLDEPTTGVDSHTRGQILDTIKNLQKNSKTTVIYTSHYMEEIEYICDDIALLHKGEIILHERKDELVKKYESLEFMFLSMTKEDLIS